MISITGHYMENYSVIMALVDLIPVALFFVASMYLLETLKNLLEGWKDLVFKSGIMMIFIAGLLKAIWKIFAALGWFDFYPLNNMFLPLQAIGFIFVGCSLLAMAIKEKRIYSVAPLTLLPAYGGSVIFLALMTLGQALITTSLCLIAQKRGRKVCFVFFILSFVASMSMGGLAVLEGKLSVSLFNWIEELVNVTSQGSLLIGSILLTKNN